jgi:DHA3 family tetracycline resistance protein-like MFS transporter
LRKKVDAFTVYVILRFCASLLFSLIFTVNLIYHVTVVELTPLQLVLVGTILEATVFIFEVPTGVVADVKSRRLSIIVGYALMLIVRSFDRHYGGIGSADTTSAS